MGAVCVRTGISTRRGEATGAISFGISGIAGNSTESSLAKSAITAVTFPKTRRVRSNRLRSVLIAASSSARRVFHSAATFRSAATVSFSRSCEFTAGAGGSPNTSHEFQRRGAHVLNVADAFGAAERTCRGSRTSWPLIVKPGDASQLRLRPDHVQSLAARSRAAVRF